MVNGEVLKGRPEDRLVWCLHCERVSFESEWTGHLRMCPYDGCDGGFYGDGWDYDEHRLGQQGGPPITSWPAEPVRGTRYDVYAD